MACSLNLRKRVRLPHSWKCFTPTRTVHSTSAGSALWFRSSSPSGLLPAARLVGQRRQPFSRRLCGGVQFRAANAVSDLPSRPGGHDPAACGDSLPNHFETRWRARPASVSLQRETQGEIDSRGRLGEPSLPDRATNLPPGVEEHVHDVADELLVGEVLDECVGEGTGEGGSGRPSARRPGRGRRVRARCGAGGLRGRGPASAGLTR